MTHQFELSQQVAAPAGAIWAVLTDIDGAAQTLSGVSRIEVLTPGEYAPGFRWRETRTMLGKESTEEMWVTEADAARSTTVEAVSDGVTYTTRFTLTPSGTGTELRMVFGAELVRPSVGSRVMMAVLGRLGLLVTRRAMRRDLAEIAARAEALAAAG
ncbi:SRPBCC family protein [Actinotalea sp.]|uniref:SRPBCC family protein n=1 Tax=Actinotalea sp. TaxID=1872145 RepID=UPI0035696558